MLLAPLLAILLGAIIVIFTSFNSLGYVIVALGALWVILELARVGRIPR